MSVTITQGREGEVSAIASDHISSWIREYSSRPVLLLVSGGSAHVVLNDVTLPEDTSHLTLSVLDERLVDDVGSHNFSALAQTSFFTTFKKRGGATVNPSDDSEGVLRWRQSNPNGVVIATMGVGADGHTAGIMSYPHNKDLFDQEFEEPEQGTVSYEPLQGTSEYQRRYTVTLSFLREVIDHALVFVIGSEKKEALSRVVADEGALHHTPARIIYEMKHVVLITDQTL